MGGLVEGKGTFGAHIGGWEGCLWLSLSVLCVLRREKRTKSGGWGEDGDWEDTGKVFLHYKTF